MKALINFCFNHKRSFLFIWIVALVSGVYSYLNIAKESAPDVPVPMIVVSVLHPGISSQDSERLILRALEKELKALEGLKEIKGVAKENSASLRLEFESNYPIDKALLEVREKVNIAKSEFPEDSLEPRVKEINVALFPVLSIALSGDITYRALLDIGEKLQKKIEANKGVLSAKLSGDLKEQMEVIISPEILETYHLSLLEIERFLDKNHQLVAAGKMESSATLFNLKVPGLIESEKDALTIPLKVEGDTVLTFSDLATVRRSFESPESIANFNNQSVIVLDVSKRIGANILDVISEVKKDINEMTSHYPKALKVTYMQDSSLVINERLSDLRNNIVLAVILVMIVVIVFLGSKAGFLIGLSIPTTIISGIFVLYFFGVTLNIVVLFSLIMVIGLLVDGAIVVIEKAMRNLDTEKDADTAFLKASTRMSWPIFSSTLTTVAVFFPLLFWPGVTGGFMKYLPLTMIIMLLISFFVAIVFLPILGSLIAKKNELTKKTEKASKGLSLYLDVVEFLLGHAKKVIFAMLLFFIFTVFIFTKLGKGVSFFPDIDSDYIQVQVLSKSDFSIYEKQSIIREVNQKLQSIPEVKHLFSESFSFNRKKEEMAEDAIGRVQIELVSWQDREKSSIIVEKVREKLSQIAGAKFIVNEKKAGPRTVKPIEVELTSRNKSALIDAGNKVKKLMHSLMPLRDIETTADTHGIDWYLYIDRREAARYGADVSLLGAMVQMVSNGVKLTEYQPDDLDEEIDIRLRFPEKDRNFSQLSYLKVPTQKGEVPASHFIQLKYQPKVGKISHRQILPAISLRADVKKGVVASKAMRLLKEKIKGLDLDGDVRVDYKGEQERMSETANFLIKAFCLALFLMTLILLTQFNSFYQTFIILSAILFSVSGVLMEVLIANKPFGLVMAGLGIIALAGIVVNNNIVLIDTFNRRINQGQNLKEAILNTCQSRMRPVLLTSGTTILGLLPMAFSITINLWDREVLINSPSSQWWVDLSSAIASGLLFATFMTLIVTPCLLSLCPPKKC